MNTDWKNLISEIKKGNCAIFLGHGLLPGNGETPLYSGLCDRLAAEHANLLSAYYSEENFFLFKEPRFRTKIINEIEDYYDQLKIDDELALMYKRLAEIPVKLYISVSPDYFLYQQFAGNVSFSFFKNQLPDINEIEPTREKPFLYNIFGSVQQSDSLIVSHDDLFDFLRKILGENGLPMILKKFFKEDAGGEVIFLGFDFRKWYVRLLLRIFNLSKPNNATNRTAYCNAAPLDDERLFASNHFRVDFIETKVKEFVETLHTKCANEGILRKPGESRNEAKKITEEERLKRIKEIREYLIAENKLRSEYEEKLILSDDPKEKEKCRREIEDITTRINGWNTELATLSK